MKTTSTGRLAEHLVCAELGRRGLVATTFTHNIPKFDLVVVDDNCCMLPIQVKGTNDLSWTFDADKLMEINFDEEKQTQSIVGIKACSDPELIWVCVVVKPPTNPSESQPRDQFFICTKRKIHQICVNNYRMMLERYGGHRPRKWKSLRYFWSTADLGEFENKWETIRERMSQLCIVG